MPGESLIALSRSKMPDLKSPHNRQSRDASFRFGHGFQSNDLAYYRPCRLLSIFLSRSIAFWEKESKSSFPERGRTLEDLGTFSIPRLVRYFPRARLTSSDL